MNIEKQKAYVKGGQTMTYLYRIEQLKKLYDTIVKWEGAILEALKKDLNKTFYESYLTEVGFVLKSISYTRKHLKRWMKTKKVKTPFYQLFTTSYIKPEPLGTVLIIGAYNYPFQLLIEPLIGAIAAGNTVVLKPSEQAVHMEKVIVEMFKETFDDRYIKVVTGDAKVTSDLLELPFDHIFFTGSTKVGQIVYEKAAKQLIPVTLELGGKSPAIVTKHANLKHSAKRIAFGKLINAGQTCIAPDYVYVDADVKDEFVMYLKQMFTQFMGNHKTFGSMINDKHYNRVLSLVDDTRGDAEKRIIEPIITVDVTWEDAVMKEEIFGPILPIMTYKNMDDMIDTLKEKEKPLALYLFSDDKHEQHTILTSLSFGGGCINDVLMHIANPNLPFGGIGKSGIGAYHGYTSFRTFSHFKGYTKKGFKYDLPMTYFPATDKKLSVIKKFLK